MRSSRPPSAIRVLVAATPPAVALIVAGTVLLIRWDRGLWLLVVGFVLLAGGVAAVHTILSPRYGELGLVAFLLTEVSLVLIGLFGLGFVTLALANPLLAYALVLMKPPLRASAAALLAVWAVIVVVAALTPLVVVESMGTFFALPYAVLAVESLRLRDA